MNNKIKQKMYDSDGAGREFLTAEIEDAVHARLEARGFTAEELGQAAYDRMFDEELILLQSEAEEDYQEFLLDQHESYLASEEFFMNRPGGEADYMYG